MVLKKKINCLELRKGEYKVLAAFSISMPPPLKAVRDERPSVRAYSLAFLSSFLVFFNNDSLHTLGVLTYGN